jgi:hypothetical protein
MQRTEYVMQQAGMKRGDPRIFATFLYTVLVERFEDISTGCRFDWLPDQGSNLGPADYKS